jgi:hypothetical protein
VGTQEAILADLYRRAGQFGQVAAICDEGLAKGPGEVITKILEFQKTLAERRDLARHTVAHARDAGGTAT